MHTLLTEQQLAQEFGVSPKVIAKCIATRLLVAHKIEKGDTKLVARGCAQVRLGVFGEIKRRTSKNELPYKLIADMLRKRCGDFDEHLLSRLAPGEQPAKLIKEISDELMKLHFAA